MTISHVESVRLHEDWWGKCRTCRFWNAVHIPKSFCTNVKSPFFVLLTDEDDKCNKWDSFDTEVALATMGKPSDNKCYNVKYNGKWICKCELPISNVVRLAKINRFDLQEEWVDSHPVSEAGPGNAK